MKRLTLALGLVALAAVLAACSGASAAPTTTDAPAPTTAVPAGPAGDTVAIAAKDLKFVQTDVAVPAGTPFTIDFDNQEGAPHNIAISDASGASMFKGEIVAGAKIAYSVPALTAGTYTFICEVHPDMQGTITAR